MDDREHWMEDEDAAEEELRLLEAMTGVSTAMQQFNQVLAKLNRQSVELSKELGTAERQLSSSERRTTLSVPTVAAMATPEAQRTEL
ncbi:Hypothetical protein PHPALM_20463 [Phytophthora palmivora]|uniref:Uncharacterized protein n=1 Tax=Phytophthora palmivora TaxID=4796 RepID=A0A2P4XEU9_9STRA|nr:Hypothetical protein PHPALM_20463 [Phytophthora palmivora]